MKTKTDESLKCEYFIRQDDSERGNERQGDKTPPNNDKKFLKNEKNKEVGG